jgi:probable F420-dependent oxidoreductase
MSTAHDVGTRNPVRRRSALTTILEEELVATDRKIRFGLASAVPESAASWKEVARKAEDLGYSTLLLADHMGRGSAPLISAMAAAAATTRLRLGTQVLSNEFRNPAVLAKEIATLDLLSEGRFELGIGAGWPPTSNTGRNDMLQTGLPPGEGGERVTRLIEAVRIIKAFLSGDEPITFEGKMYHVQGLTPMPRAMQKPHPPIMIAGAGPRIVKFAAREADIINIAPRPPTVGPTPVGSMSFGLTMADEINIIREAAGDRYSQIELSVFAQAANVTDDEDAALDKVAHDLNTTREAADDMPATLVGPVDSVVERILRHREKYDITYRVIPFASMDAMAPVIAKLAGK